MTKSIVFEPESGAIAVANLWPGAMLPAEIVHHPAVVVHRPAIADADGNEIEPAHDEITAEAYDETVTPAETEQQFIARMVAQIVPQGARHIVVDAAALPPASPDHWLIDWTAGTVTSDAAKIAADGIRALTAYAALKRWRVETAGFIDSDGRAIATDRESQSKLIAEMVAIGAGIRAEPSQWKLRDGSFASLTNAQMQAVIIAARTHIATAFAVEREAATGIAAGTITTEGAIDALQWPG